MSPWGKQSGGHINPAMTLAFYGLGKIAPWDALFYGVAQFSGATSGVALATFLLRGAPGNGAVRYAVTTPGVYGAVVAFAAELVISFILMITVLLVTNYERLSRYTPYVVGSLYAVNITFETPLSGMSMNPARTFGPAAYGGYWHTLWIDLFHRTDARHAGSRCSVSSGSPGRAPVLRQAVPCQQQALHIPSQVLRAKLAAWNHRRKAHVENANQSSRRKL